MKKLLAGAMALVMCTVTGCTPSVGVQTAENPETKETTVYEQAVSAAETEIGTVYSAEETMGYFNELFLKETLKGGGNFVISPLSAKLALNMAAAGAEEGSDTEKELLALFGYENAEEMKEQSKSVIDSLNGGKGIIEVNNSVWVSDKLDGLKKDYSKGLKKYFNAKGFTENLSGNEFVDKINGWVDKNTKGLIPKFLSKPLGDHARLVLVNTLYFKNDWETRFVDFNTRDAIFFSTDKTASVPTMHNTFHTDYREGGRLKSVILPYVDGSEMRIFLPADSDAAIRDVIAEMSAEELSEELNGSYGEKNVQIALPKFECDYSGSLQEMLQRLGVKSAFDPSAASFGDMADTNGEPLYISDVLQAAKIICDEEGTEAAAATAGILMCGGASVPEETIVFRVDRPFVYEILSPDGETLFMGYIENL